MAAITQEGVAITYVKDVTFTITGAGADNGEKIIANRTLGDSVTFLNDEVEIEFENRDEDHSQGQALYEHMRTRKKAQTARFNRKMEKGDALAALLAVNEVVVISVTGTSAGNVPEPFAITNGLAKVGTLSGTFGAPSGMRVTLSSYGVAWA